MNLHQPLYYYWTAILPPELCELIIKTCDPLPRSTGQVGNSEFGGKGQLLTQYRSSSVAGVNKPHWIYGLVEYYAQLANQAMFHYDIQETQVIQYSSYEAGQEYTWHRDSGGPPDDKGHIRKLSMSIQLDDPGNFTGGDFRLRNADYLEIVPEEFRPRGSIIVFPSSCQHRVCPVTSGVRRSLVAWFLGPAFR
jgi:PKHD-type hydroxylase